MANRENGFMNKLSQNKIMSDGMLFPVKYGEFSMAMVLKDKPKGELINPKENFKEFR